MYTFSSVQLLSHVRLFATPWIAARQASLSITNSRSSLTLMSIEWVMPSSHLILCLPLIFLSPIPPSIRVFSNESTLRTLNICNYICQLLLDKSGKVTFGVRKYNYFPPNNVTYASSVQFSHSVVSDSLRPHESQHARPPCLSPTPWVHSDSCPSNLWCHQPISSSVVPFSSCPQSLPASESYAKI